MNHQLTKCLEDLARRVDPRQEQSNRNSWEQFAMGRFAGDVFTPPKRTAAPPPVDWPKVLVNQAFVDREMMLLQQLSGVSQVLAEGRTSRLNIRCNYGSSILPSLFGVELFMMSDESDTLPTSHPLHSSEGVKKLLDKGVPDIRAGLGEKVFAAVEFFQDVLGRYPILRNNIDIYHPDVQGPIDVAEVVWGSEIFFAFGDEPELVKDFLALITQTYIAFMREWYKRVPPTGECSAHWGWTHRGRIALRNDSLMNLSPEIYREFIRPMDQKLLDEFGGGMIHFCGRGDHFIDAMTELRGLYTVNLSQPHLNDMATIFRSTVDRGIMVVGLEEQAARNAGRTLHGRVHCD